MNKTLIMFSPELNDVENEKEVGDERLIEF
jgi:hypothetical protein